jgi:hypothetical protein
MTIRADRDRQRVYDAEVTALGGTLLDQQLAWDDLQALFDAVVHHVWWRSLGVRAPVLRRARRDAARSSSDGTTVRMARHGQDGLTLAHELAHHIVAARCVVDPGHGPAFCGALLRTVEVIGGPSARRHLATELTRVGLTAARWDGPEPAVESALGATLAAAGPGRLRGAIPLPAG